MHSREVEQGPTETNLSEQLHGISSENRVLYWLSPESNPIAIDLDPEEAIMRAVSLARETHKAIGGEEADITDPPKGDKLAKASHNLLLLLLDNTNVDYGIMASYMERYKYRSVLLRAIGRARRATESNADMNALYKRLRADYPRRLIGLSEKPAATTEPPSIFQQETNSEEAEQQTPEQWLQIWRNTGSTEAEDKLLELLGGIMDQCSESVQGWLRSEAIDISWEEFYNVINSALPWESIPDTLQRKLVKRIAKKKAAYRRQRFPS